MLKKNCLLEMSEEGDELCVCLSGEIDHHSAVWVRAEIDERISLCQPRRAVLELSGIDFMDSSGLGLIMGRYAKMKAIGGELIIRSPGERMMKIIRLAGLERIVTIESACEEKEKNNEA